jgi:hypothetical protein
LTYQNSTYKFSFQHPKNWVLSEENQNYIEFKNGTDSLKFMLTDPGVGMVVLGTEKVKVGTKEIEFSLVGNNKGVLILAVADYASIQKEGSVYTITFYSDNFDKTWPEVKKILSTFKFLN